MLNQKKPIVPEILPITTDRLIGLDTVIDLVRLKRSKIASLMSMNLFPANVIQVDENGKKIRTRSWRLSDIQKYISALPIQK